MRKSWYILMDGNRKVAGGQVAEMSLIRAAQQNEFHAKHTGYKWELLPPRFHETYIGEMASW